MHGGGISSEAWATHVNTLAPIGASTDVLPDFRELTVSELSEMSFVNYFRFSFTKRMDRDQALALARKIEVFVGEITTGDTRVYVGIKNVR